MKLTEPQKRYLRGLAHALKPCVNVGSAGVTPALLVELGNALSHHELLKVKIRASDRDKRDAAISALVEQTRATLVNRIGHVALLYRRDAENPRLQLPPG